MESAFLTIFGAALTALVAGLLVGTAAVAPFLKCPVLTGFGVFLEN